MTFWIGIACADHVRGGVEGSFAQLGHGKHAAVKSLKRGDWIAYYSATSRMGGSDAVLSFTALGRVTSDAAYQAEQKPDFHPWRVDVDYIGAAKAAPIRPLLEDLDLTRGKGANWGMAVRGAKVKATDADLRTIAGAMGVTVP